MKSSVVVKRCNDKLRISKKRTVSAGYRNESENRRRYAVNKALSP